ncbi:hypothetical protein [Lewinella sp. LCG006]|uniref:hypothetical protein n=1 Tax=Lewinella sp. LCG006 TaxID=3231911 RepID=UPI00345FC048
MKKVGLLFVLLVLGYLLQLGGRMFFRPTIVENGYGKYSKDLYQQLQFLKDEIQQGAGEDMQAIYPEGTVFLHALYALSWANLVAETKDPQLRAEALQACLALGNTPTASMVGAILMLDQSSGKSVALLRWLGWGRWASTLQPNPTKD